jgi:hypothetical protein
MNPTDKNIEEKILKQFETSPFPRIPIETSPKSDIVKLYINNLTTANYQKNKKIILPAGKLIRNRSGGV